MTIFPLSFNCSSKGGGTSGQAAVTIILSNGAYSFTPKDPSPSRTFTFVNFNCFMLDLANSTNSATLSIVYTNPRFPTNLDNIAACHPEPAPTSSIFWFLFTSNNSVIITTVEGWDMVCPYSIDSGTSL